MFVDGAVLSAVEPKLNRNDKRDGSESGFPNAQIQRTNLRKVFWKIEDDFQVDLIHNFVLKRVFSRNGANFNFLLKLNRVRSNLHT